MCIYQECDILCCGCIFDFLYQFGQIGEWLCLFVEFVFIGNCYQCVSCLCGFYLISVLYLVQQLDEDIVGIGVNLGIVSGLLLILCNGCLCFIYYLLSQVIFFEVNLVGFDCCECMCIYWGQCVLYVGLLVFFLLFGLFWVGGFLVNYECLEWLCELVQ